MRVMVMIKATTNTEAGMLPTEQLVSDMTKFNEALVQAGVMLAGDGLKPTKFGKRVLLPGRQASGDRRPVRRDQGSRRRLLGLAGEVHGRGARLDASLSASHAR